MKFKPENEMKNLKVDSNNKKIGTVTNKKEKENSFSSKNSGYKECYNRK